MALNIDELTDWDALDEELRAVSQKYSSQLLELGYGDAADLIGYSRDGATLVFDLTNPNIKRILKDRAKLVGGASDTTKSEIQTLLDQQTEDGWSISKLAQEIGARMDGISKSRASTIARTESGTTYNLGAHLSYSDAGVKTVEVLDGDQDEDCSSVDGTKQSLDWMEENPLGHPNCTRAFAPVVDW